MRLSVNILNHKLEEFEYKLSQLEEKPRDLFIRARITRQIDDLKKAIETLSKEEV